MQIQRVDLEQTGSERDASVVIDVLRAFTTAAFAFEAGAKEIFPVGTIDEAFRLRDELGEALLMGEDKGYPIEGFDLGNSPAALLGLDLSGICLIQRTTAGTQGLVRSARSKHLLAASLCNASATVRALEEIAPKSLTFVETGVHPGGWGEEDSACADLLQARLCGERLDPQVVIQRVLSSREGRYFAGANDPDLPAADLDLAIQIDRFDFAMQVCSEGGRMVLRQRNDH